MRIVNAGNVRWQRDGGNIRGGAGLILKRLLTGQPGTPENYLLNMARSDGDYATPRHRHNFDQIRVALDGDMRIGPRQVVRQGQIGYFPEGAFYGPYDDAGRKRTIMIVQFGGASGNGYMDRGSAMAARDSLLREGEFRGGVFRRSAGQGRTNQDAFEATWERFAGRKLEYPRPRYDAPVIVDPAGFAWTAAGRRGVSRKRLGAFTERETRLEMIRLEPGAEWTSPAARAIQLYFVMAGSGKCGTGPYRRYTAIETRAGETAVFRADRDTEILCLVMPLVETRRGRAAA